MEQRKGQSQLLLRVSDHVYGAGSSSSSDVPTRQHTIITRKSKKSISGLSALFIMLGLIIASLTVFTLVANKKAVSAKMRSFRETRGEVTLVLVPNEASQPPMLKSDTMPILEKENSVTVSPSMSSASTTDVAPVTTDIAPALLEKVNELKQLVKAMRSDKHFIMPWNPEAIEMTTKLQAATRCYLAHTLGDIRKKVILAVALQFPSMMVEAHDWLRLESSGSGNVTLFVEMAPMDLLPHATFTILEIAKSYQRGSFHRNAGHVLQAAITCLFKGGLVFMEYDRSYRHEKYTLGFAGRGGGNAIYINTENNTMTHGPGTDRGGKDPESDTVWGRVLSLGSFEQNGKRIVDIMRKQPGGIKPNGFIGDRQYHIGILSIKAVLSTADQNSHGITKEFQSDMNKNDASISSENIYYNSEKHSPTSHQGIAFIKQNFNNARCRQMFE